MPRCNLDKGVRQGSLYLLVYFASSQKKAEIVLFMTGPPGLVLRFPDCLCLLLDRETGNESMSISLSEQWYQFDISYPPRISFSASRCLLLHLPVYYCSSAVALAVALCS